MIVWCLGFCCILLKATTSLDRIGLVLFEKKFMLIPIFLEKLKVKKVEFLQVDAIFTIAFCLCRQCSRTLRILKVFLLVLANKQSVFKICYLSSIFLYPIKTWCHDLIQVMTTMLRAICSLYFWAKLKHVSSEKYMFSF